MAKNAAERQLKRQTLKEKTRKNNKAQIYCYYDDAIYSPGAYVKVDGLERKMLYCNASGAWEVKDSPED